MNKAIEMGYEYTQIKDFIEDKGLAEYNFDLFATHIENKNYKNTLFTPKKEEQKGGQEG